MINKTTWSSSIKSQPQPLLHVISTIALWLMVSIGAFLFLLWTTQTAGKSHKNIRYGLVAPLLFFNNLNILISFWEIALGNHIMLIKEDYKKLKQQYAGKELSAVASLLFTPVPLDRVLDGKFWSRIWSYYALFDPSYQNHESFGFFADVGNGWTTIPPCLLMNLAMTMPQLSICNPLLVGCVCLASYWQNLYGTLIYCLSYIFNKRYRGKTLFENVGFVGTANGIWFFFPLVGIYACVSMLDTKDFSVFECYDVLTTTA